MQHDIEIIPGTSGTVGHELGLVLNYKIPASGKPVDLSGAELVFIASAGAARFLSKPRQISPGPLKQGRSWCPSALRIRGRWARIPI